MMCYLLPVPPVSPRSPAPGNSKHSALMSVINVTFVGFSQANSQFRALEACGKCKDFQVRGCGSARTRNPLLACGCMLARGHLFPNKHTSVLVWCCPLPAVLSPLHRVARQPSPVGSSSFRTACPPLQAGVGRAWATSWTQTAPCSTLPHCLLQTCQLAGRWGLAARCTRQLKQTCLMCQNVCT